MTIISDSWFTVTELDETTFAISEYGHWEKVHSFLLIGTNKAALIDTGLGIDNIKRITDQLTDLPIIVLTTHVHTDHIGSHGEFTEIYVHEAESDWLINGIEGLSLEQIRINIGRDITKATPASFNSDTFTPFQGEPTGLLVDGDKIDIGNRLLEIIHTPGHSPGHCCIYEKGRRYLFTGDLLYLETPIYAFYPTTDPEELVNSLERIAKIENVKTVYGSHNQLGIDASILDEVLGAVKELRDRNVVRHGSGLHSFRRFSVQF
ncbi:MBL fold metallo-hydrolase [Oceanobacillus sp. 143]|uniref:MBL fold metallo-hydrolase n=1 Tax=Oceanobacillus zhaokaii TaxID=2052660 RepID=A0A345PEW6_9BACI|nr:MBL fold metallo-hydrolase [Oceanobacillus zhaokaii]AXI08546.1 MBL fold metallo-hydrolase [Oceanobacillus zhaokaii]QGS68366.1 MBL fold metallo-hydrolase [Oceanobacillus sp. 143]